jgi:hypothetical protein
MRQCVTVFIAKLHSLALVGRLDSALHFGLIGPSTTEQALGR